MYKDMSSEKNAYGLKHIRYAALPCQAEYATLAVKEPILFTWYRGKAADDWIL